MLRTINRRNIVLIILIVFVVLCGMVYCNVNVFTNPELKSKWYWTYVAIPLCGLLFLCKKNKCAFRFDKSVVWAILLLLYYILRVTEKESILPFISIVTLFLLTALLSASMIRNHLFVHTAAAMTVSASLLALYGIGQYMGILPPGKTFTVIGTFDNPAGYASSLAFCTPFILYFTLFGALKVRRAAWLSYILVCVAVILSASRTGILTVVAIGFMYILRQYKKQVSEIATWKKIVLAGVMLFFVAGLYLLKQDSANGRLLIWRCSWNMILEKPLLGYGYGNFKAEYMLYQARYFEQNPESKLGLLADNVKHPFNEFLRVTVEFGLIGTFLLLFFIIQLIRIYRKNKTDEAYSLISAMAATIVFANFSYPFSYPFTWFIVAFCSGGLLSIPCKNEGCLYRSRTIKSAIALLSIALLSITIKDMHHNIRWHHAMPLNTQTVFSEYEELYPVLKNDVYFLYNYAAKFNRIREFEKSAAVIQECEKMLNDYDIQMLKADNYKNMTDFYLAEKSYLQASRMCPGRFMPLYELVNVYDSTGRSDMALKLAYKIVDKPVKIPSGAVVAIKMQMKERIKTKSQ